MWKAVIKVAMATTCVLAIVLAGTVMLIDASTVDIATSRNLVAKDCRAPRQLSLPRAPLLPENISAAPDTPEHRPHASHARKASLGG
jgi:hypothetical protein